MAHQPVADTTAPTGWPRLVGPGPRFPVERVPHVDTFAFESAQNFWRLTPLDRPISDKTIAMLNGTYVPMLQMQSIVVRNLKGEPWGEWVHRYDPARNTGLDLKKKLAETTGISPERQTLVTSTSVMVQDTDKLASIFDPAKDPNVFTMVVAPPEEEEDEDGDDEVEAAAAMVAPPEEDSEEYDEWETEAERRRRLYRMYLRNRHGGFWGRGRWTKTI